MSIADLPKIRRRIQDAVETAMHQMMDISIWVDNLSVAACALRGNEEWYRDGNQIVVTVMSPASTQTVFIHHTPQIGRGRGDAH